MYNQKLFSSKANTLDYFQNRIKKSKIEKMYFFSVKEWKNNKENVLNKIQKEFESYIVIRSSAKGEDSINESQAGKFKTVLNINSRKRNIISKAISEVISSYGLKKNADQVLIQKQTLNSITSGVIFTKTLSSNSPYYVINYEDGHLTDSVTKGKISNVIKIHNKTENKIIPKKWKKLIDAIKEIEDISKNYKLDIEFAITKKEIVIFQVRPLTTQNKINEKQVSQHVKNEIISNVKKFQKMKNNKTKKLIFSNMTDWNPAEIIGEKPKELEYSLYDYLIMKQSWNAGRNVLGYNNIKEPLMERFSGKPYVNVGTSFQSLIPKKINLKFQKKMLSYFFDKLEKNPEIHDKVEFEILFTCYDFSIKKRLHEMKEYGLTNYDIKKITKQLVEFTNNVIEKTPELLKNMKNEFEILELKRLEKNKNKNKRYDEKLNDAIELLKDCRDFGTTNFSMVARLAFIATILLKTISDVSKIKKEIIEQINNSISTPVTDFQNDLIRLKLKKISKSEFLEKYGHLRPGTYDITIQRYDDMPELLDDFDSIEVKRIAQTKKNKLSKEFSYILKKHGLVFSNISFLEFISQTISLREKAKFEFSKSLSDSIELIASAGENIGFTRNDLSYLALNDILKFKKLDLVDLKNKWTEKIKINKDKFWKNEFVELPPIIFSKDEFNVIPHYIARPNYITKKKILSNIVNIDEVKKSSDINSKIILIDNADPGYDWIFSKKPSGLITKYGGVASHMAIRCSELELPAAIGCGEILFNKLKTISKINLDCKNEDITVIKFKEKHSFSEEKRILRSLGYIR